MTASTSCFFVLPEYAVTGNILHTSSHGYARMTGSRITGKGNRTVYATELRVVYDREARTAKLESTDRELTFHSNVLKGNRAVTITEAYTDPADLERYLTESYANYLELRFVQKGLEARRSQMKAELMDDVLDLFGDKLEGLRTFACRQVDYEDPAQGETAVTFTYAVTGARPGTWLISAVVKDAKVRYTGELEGSIELTAIFASLNGHGERFTTSLYAPYRTLDQAVATIICELEFKFR